MMETHKQPRRSSSLQNHTREPHHGDPIKPGSKRLFSNRDSRQPDKASENGEVYGKDEEDESAHNEKRRRASDWPLPSTHNIVSTPAPVQNRHTPNSTHSHRRPSSSLRPSKFVEGSMKDRISDKPPTTFTAEEEIRDSYEQSSGDMQGRGTARPQVFMQYSNTSGGSSADGADSARHSGIVRFGKTLAASFNPSNWKIFTKISEEVEVTPEQQILRERREKAEAMYQELKKSGHFVDSTFGPSLFQRQEEEKELVSAKHDSGVSFDERRSRSISRTSRMSRETSREEKRMGRVFLEPPQLSAGIESQYSQSQNSTPQQSIRKGKFHFKRPSLSNIKKSNSDHGSISGDPHQARRVPSRKDLQKQQKLVKRVSDLEGKLEAARRQLSDALDEPLPSAGPVRRHRFVPGAMPSLPSERLLSAYGEDSNDTMSESVSVSQIGKALTMDSDFREESEYPDLNDTPRAPNFDKSLPFEPETPAYDRVVQSVELGGEEDGSIDSEDPSAATPRPAVQSVKSQKARVAQRSASSASFASGNSSELSDLEGSEYEYSESEVKHDTSPEPSEISRITALKAPTKPRASKSQASHSKKRKNTVDPAASDDKTFRPAPESESDVSPAKPKRGPKKPTVSSPPRKVQKTTGTKTGPSSSRSSAVQRRQVAPAKKPLSVSSKTSKSNITSIGRESVSPPPSTSFAGLDYKKPASQPVNGGSEDGAARMATFSAIPSADGSDVPPVPKLPKQVRLASGEVINIPAQNGNDQISGVGKSKAQKAGSNTKLTQTRPTPSSQKGGEGVKSTTAKNGDKEQYDWPEDVF